MSKPTGEDPVFARLIPIVANLPWESRVEDWFCCLCPLMDRTVFLENVMLSHLLANSDLPGAKHVQLNPEPLENGMPGWVRNMSSTYHELATSLGGALSTLPAVDTLQEGTSVAFTLTRWRYEGRLGLFGGQLFAFRPRPELERARR